MHDKIHKTVKKRRSLSTKVRIMGKALAATSSTRTFRADIQGLRAIAVGGVLLYHAGVPFLSGGYVGVDIFFVISGFLITAHLLANLERDGRIGFAAFYARRARRILPASFLVLIITVAAALVWFPPLLMQEVWRGAIATALYGPNIVFAIDRTDYLAEEAPSLFLHYWSLGVEEQFYLVWPLLLLLAWRWAPSRRSLLAVILILVTISFVAGIVVTEWRQPWAFFLLPTRAWELGIGGVLALMLARRAHVVPVALAPIVGWLGVAAMLAPMFLFSALTPFPGYWAAVPVMGAALVILAGATPASYAPTWFLSQSVMQFLGKISYSLYLVHWPALIIPGFAVGYADSLPLGAKLVIAALCVPVAWLMYRYVEQPFRKSPWLTSAPPRRTLLAASGASVTAILVATAVFAFSEVRPLNAGKSTTDTFLQALPVGTAYVPSNLIPSLAAASDDIPILYRDGCLAPQPVTDLAPCVYGPPDMNRIVLFGDSHAAHWFPALLLFAEKNGYTLESRTKSGCPSVQVTVLRNALEYAKCDIWRESVIHRINDDPPALVVITNSTDHTISGDGDIQQVWQSGLEATIGILNAPIVMIADTPSMPSSPAVCLSAHLTDTKACGANRTEALGAPARAGEAAAARATGVTYIDLTDYMCNAQTCDPILGNTLVYRDAHHITTAFSRAMAPLLGATLAHALNKDR